MNSKKPRERIEERPTPYPETVVARQWVQFIRERDGWTASDFAQLLGVGVSWVSQLCNRREIAIPHHVALRLHLGITVEEYYRGPQCNE